MTQTFEPITRVNVPELDAVLGRPFPVLDDGFVRLIDYMGNDAAIVQAARVSYGSGTKRISEDRGLIRYLLRHRHTTPFEMCELKLHIRVPMDCWRQWIRHRTANVNEYSTRYSIAIDSMQATNADAWRTQSESNRQGSDGMLGRELGEQMSERERELQTLARDVYRERVEHGVAREQARKDLPLSTYTEAYWKVDLHNLLHFLELRMEEHAQLEIREYAATIGDEIVKRWLPLAWQAFEDYGLARLDLTRLDQQALALIAAGDMEGARAFAEGQHWLFERDGQTRKARELIELEEKLERLGLANPWAE